MTGKKIRILSLAIVIPLATVTPQLVILQLVIPVIPLTAVTPQLVIPLANNDQKDNQNRESIILSVTRIIDYLINILFHKIVSRIYYPVENSVLNFISYLLKDMNLEFLLFIPYSSTISLKIVYPTEYSISFRLIIIEIKVIASSIFSLLVRRSL